MTDAQKLALERYRNILSYLQYEQAIYWTRVGFVITAQAALAGLGARFIYEALQVPTVLSIAMSAGICVMALSVGVIGIRTTTGSLRWIYRWQDILRKLEPDAYGEIEVFRGTEAKVPGLPNHSVRAAANHILYVFIAAWLILLVCLVWRLVCK